MLHAVDGHCIAHQANERTNNNVNRPEVSVALCTYNRADLLRKTLAALMRLIYLQASVGADRCR